MFRYAKILNYIKKISIFTLILLIFSCGNDKKSSGGNSKANPSGNVIKVGSKDFTENLIVGEIYALALEDNGYTVKRIPNIAGSVIHTSIVNGEIDLYPEYTGTGLLSILKLPLQTDPNVVYETVKREYADKFNLIWLDYAKANDSQGLVIRTETADKLGIRTISDLQSKAAEIRFASQGEFDQREDGIPGLEKTYGKFNWKSSTVYDNSLKYQILKSNDADVAPAYTTEGQLVNTSDFTILVDDKHFWPPYNLAPVIRAEILTADKTENNNITNILNNISSKLDTETITKLNARVDVDGEEYETVAKEFYESIK